MARPLHIKYEGQRRWLMADGETSWYEAHGPWKQPRWVGKYVDSETPVLRGCFCLCGLITRVGPRQHTIHRFLFLAEEGESDLFAGVIYFFQALYGDTPAPSVADCKIRKLLPSWGNNGLPQGLSALPAAAAKVEAQQQGNILSLQPVSMGEEPSHWSHVFSMQNCRRSDILKVLTFVFFFLHEPRHTFFKPSDRVSVRNSNSHYCNNKMFQNLKILYWI